MEEYMTVTEAARELGLSVSAMRTRVEKGYIQAQRAGSRLWLIPVAEVERWKERGRLKAWEGRKLREGRERSS